VDAMQSRSWVERRQTGEKEEGAELHQKNNILPSTTHQRNPIGQKSTSGSRRPNGLHMLEVLQQSTKVGGGLAT